MICYFKTVADGHICCIGMCDFQTENAISQTEYQNIVFALRTKPQAPDGFRYALKTDLTWELVPVPTVLPEEEQAEENDLKAALCELGVQTDD